MDHPSKLSRGVSTQPPLPAVYFGHRPAHVGSPKGVRIQRLGFHPCKQRLCNTVEGEKGGTRRGKFVSAPLILLLRGIPISRRTLV